MSCNVSVPTGLPDLLPDARPHASTVGRGRREVESIGGNEIDSQRRE